MIIPSALSGRARLCGVAVVMLLAAGAAQPGTAPTLVVGAVLAPGDPALDGIRLGASEARRAGQLFGAQLTLHEATARTAAEAAAAASGLIARHDVAVIIGGSDDAAAAALMQISRESGVLFINAGATGDSLRLRCATLTFHTAPSDTMRTDALRIGTAPAGATASAWHHSLVRYGAGQVNDRFTDMFDRTIDDRAWSGWFGVKVVWEAFLRARSSEPEEIAARLVSDDLVFDGHKGIPLSFRRLTHQLRQPLYVIADDSVLAEVPSPRDEPELDHTQLLDRIGNQEAAASCDH